MTPEERWWIVIAVGILGTVYGALGTLWMRISNVSTRHEDRLVAAVNSLGQKISENTRELHMKVDDRVRQVDLDRQLEPIKKSIDLLREESQRREEQSERRHNERAAEHKELIRRLDGILSGKS